MLLKGKAGINLLVPTLNAMFTVDGDNHTNFFGKKISDNLPILQFLPKEQLRFGIL